MRDEKLINILKRNKCIKRISVTYIEYIIVVGLMITFENAIYSCTCTIIIDPSNTAENIKRFKKTILEFHYGQRYLNYYIRI